MKLHDIEIGDTIIADEGFPCMAAGSHEVHADEDGHLFVWCKGEETEDGVFPYGPTKHHLDGQVDEPGGDVIGFSWPDGKGPT